MDELILKVEKLSLGHETYHQDWTYRRWSTLVLIIGLAVGPIMNLTYTS